MAQGCNGLGSLSHSPLHSPQALLKVVSPQDGQLSQVMSEWMWIRVLLALPSTDMLVGSAFCLQLVC